MVKNYSLFQDKETPRLYEYKARGLYDFLFEFLQQRFDFSFQIGFRSRTDVFVY